MKNVFLVCNAHLDLVWQWEWEEGLAEALSTFRIAADFCEQFDVFIFNHNESILYQWVEEYEPELFCRIQRLVQEGKWHIMGGWYLQPDCNMPSGESIVRQISTGRTFFREKFGKAPTTAISFDAFGHSRGLVQILKRAGYDSYIVGRPSPHLFNPPARDFHWVGYDGSQVMTHISYELYNTFLGRAVEKIQQFCSENEDKEDVLVLWGIGNHGGGPSKIDLEKIAKLQQQWQQEGICLKHSTPEAYFEALAKAELPCFDGSMNPMMIGCYTSQVLIKQAHRQLENMLFSTEKLVSAMELQLGKKGNWSRIREAEQALLFSQFHDILPGSSVKRAEEASLRSLHYGLELLNRERMKAFMAFASIADVQKQEGDIPILVMNAHPYPVRKVVACEFQLQDQNRSGTHTAFEVYHRGVRIPAQLEKEDSTIPIDWRKKLLFETELAPFEVSVILCRPVVLSQKPQLRQTEEDYIELQGGKTVVRIHKASGLLEMTHDSKPMLREHSARLMVIQGSEDPWGMRVSSYPDIVGQFTLVDAVRAGEIAGLQHPIAPVRVIERGAVRTVVEGIFAYQRSVAIVHYGLEHATGKLEITIHLQWMEPDKMVKMSLLPAGEQAKCLAQDLFGRKETMADGAETVAQQWVMVTNEAQAFAVLNTGSYAHDFADHQLNLTLLHSPAYCAHPVDDRVVLPQDRWLPRVDMGERSFRFVLCPGQTEELLRKVDVMAQLENEPPFALSFFPSGESKQVTKGMTLDNESILLSAMTKKDAGYLIRLFNPLEEAQMTTLEIPAVPIKATMHFTPFEVKTLLLRGTQLEEVLLDGDPKPEGGIVHLA